MSQNPGPVRCSEPVLSVRFSLSAAGECALCNRRMIIQTGPILFLDGTSHPVCRGCGQIRAPHLVSLMDMAHEAEECATLEDANFAYVEMQKLWRAIEDYYTQLQDFARKETG